MIAHVFDIHFTSGNAESAIVTLRFVKLDPDESDAAKKSVQRAQGAKETTEQTENKDTADCNQNQQGKFPREQRAKGIQQRFVGFVNEQENAPFESARRTDIFAETGNHKDNRHQYDQPKKHHVFEIGKHASNAALFQLRRFKLVKELLKKPDRTKESANSSPQQQPEQNQNAEYVGNRTGFRRQKSVLQRAQGTRRRRAGAGIAVHTGHANVFRRSHI